MIQNDILYHLKVATPKTNWKKQIEGKISERLGLSVPYVRRIMRFNYCVAQAKAGLFLRCAVLRDNMRAYIQNSEMQFSVLFCALLSVPLALHCAPGLTKLCPTITYILIVNG